MAISSVGRTQIDAAVTLSSGQLLPGAENPNAMLLVAVAMAAGTSPSVTSLSWGGLPLALFHRAGVVVGGATLANEWWWRMAPPHGAQILGGSIAGVPRLMAEVLYVDYIDTVSPFGPVEYLTGTGAAVALNLNPTHDVGTIVDLFNGRDFAYGMGGSYTPGAGQGFVNLGTVGTAAGLYVITNKAASNGNSQVGGTIVPDMPWLYSALELRAPGEPGQGFPPPVGEKHAKSPYLLHELRERTGINFDER